MLIGRLCLELGIFDVATFLEKTEPSDWNLRFWEAFDRVEPIGQQWRQTAQMQSSLSLLGSTILVAHGFESREPFGWQDYMPPRFKRLPQDVKTVTNDVVDLESELLG